MASQHKPVIQVEKFSYDELKFNIGIASVINQYTNYLPALRIDEIQDLLDMLSLL